MSDVGIFPSLPGLGWSVTKTPTFQTRIQRAVSGRELRALDYPYPLWQFTLVFSLLRDQWDVRSGNGFGSGYDELRTLMGFYMECQGAYGTFLFHDYSDDQMVGQYLGTGDSSANVFQLQRTIGAALPGGGFVEPIIAPNAVSAVYFDGVVQNPSGYSIDPATGLLAFTTPPPTGLVITADFTYYFRCRFIDDSYSFDNFMYQLWNLKKLTFISVRP